MTGRQTPPKSLARHVRVGDLVVGMGTVSRVTALCGDVVLFYKNGNREGARTFDPDMWLHVIRERKA